MKMLTSQKHFIPGYTGHHPQYEHRKMEPCKSVFNQKFGDLSQYYDNFNVERPNFRDIGLIGMHKNELGTIYRAPMVPGYAGFIPYLDEQFGMEYSKASTISIAKHDKNLQKFTNARQLLQYRKFLQQNPACDYDDNDKEMVKSNYKLPLHRIKNTFYDKIDKVNVRDNFKFEIYLKNSGLMPHYTGHIPGAIFRFGSTFGNDTVNAKRWLSKY